MNTELIKLNAQQIRRDALLKWLADHDYIINKIVLGEWSETDPRFITYKEERQQVREKLDEIETLINSN